MPLNATIPRPIPEEFVPPFATGRIPVISLAPPARLIAEEEMRPATEWRTPVPSAPKLMVPFAWRAEVEAKAEAVMAVDEAKVTTPLVEFRFWIVDEARAIRPFVMETRPFVPTTSDEVPVTAVPFAL